LHEPRTEASEIIVSALSVELENDLRSIYSRSRSLDEVTREIAALRDKMTERRRAYEQEYNRTSQIIESRFDESVPKVFKRLREELPNELAEFDQDLADLVEGYLANRKVDYQRLEKSAQVVFDVSRESRLPADVGEGRRFSTGDARFVVDAEALNLAHPLVRAAIADARNWSSGSVLLELPRNASHELAALVGRIGVIRVALVDYNGFEPVQRLVFGAVIDGTPVDPALAGRIARLKATEASFERLTVDDGLLSEALEEAVFVDQRDVEKGEQKHFDQAIGQLERFVEDKVIVFRRERASIDAKLRFAKERRDQVVGSSARDRIEAEINQLATKNESLDHRIDALESREDEVYKKWKNKHSDLRYQPLTIRLLIEATFQICQTNSEMSC
jgi:hypothetical protein